MRYVAFFDLDHTILKINSGEVLIRRAYKNGLLSPWKLIHIYSLSLLYKVHLIDPLSIIVKIGGWLAESAVHDIETLCNEIIEKDLIPAIRPEIIAEMRMHKVQGAQLVILSSAIASICIPIAKHLGMHSVICSELEVVNQHYTGRSKSGYCFRNEKLSRMNQYLEANNYIPGDSWYYADSIDDLPVLQSVGHAVCINPGRKLKKITQQLNWVMHKWD